MLDNVELIEYTKFQKIVIPYRTILRRTKFSSNKIFCQNKFSTASQNFDNFVGFLPDFYIEILDKFFVGQNFRHQAKI